MSELAPVEGRALAQPDANPPSLLNFIALALENPAIDATKLHALLDAQERVESRYAESAFNAAFGALQLELPRIKKDGSVAYPVNKNQPDGPMKEAFKFATWENIDAVIRPLMQKHGFSLSFDSTYRDGGGAVVSGRLLHAAGHSRESSIPLALDTSGGKNNIQAMGSTFSYGKRYVATMLLNIVTEGQDDDGTRGGMVFLSAEQVSELKALIDGNKIPLDAFLEWLGGGGPENAPVSLESIEEKDFARAKNALLTRKRKTGASA